MQNRTYAVSQTLHIVALVFCRIEQIARADTWDKQIKCSGFPINVYPLEKQLQ